MWLHGNLKLTILKNFVFFIQPWTYNTALWSCIISPAITAPAKLSNLAIWYIVCLGTLESCKHRNWTILQKNIKWKTVRYIFSKYYRGWISLFVFLSSIQCMSEPTFNNNQYLILKISSQMNNYVIDEHENQACCTVYWMCLE